MHGKTVSFLFLIVIALLFSVGGAFAQGGESHADDRWEVFPASVSGSPPFPGPPFAISERPSDESQPVIAYNPIDREFLVVWSNFWGPAAWDIYAQRVSFDGRLLSWFYVGDGWYPDVAYNPVNNSYLVVYERNNDLFARRVTYQGVMDAEFSVSNTSTEEGYPRVAYNEHYNYQDFMVAWNTVDYSQAPPSSIIQAQRVAGLPHGGPGGAELIGAKLDVSLPGIAASWPDIAYNLNRNEFLVVYQQESAPSSNVFDIYGRRITANSVLLPEQVIDASGNSQYIPKVASYSPSHTSPYLVVFNDQWNDSAGDVRGYTLDGDGQPMNLVNISTAQNIYEGDPDIASSVDLGGYTVIWLKTDGDTHLWARRVAHNGALAPVYRVSDVPLSPGYASESAVADGLPLSLIAWETPVPGGLRDLVGRLLGYRINLPVILRQ